MHDTTTWQYGCARTSQILCCFRKVSWRQPSFLELPFNEHQKGTNSSDSRPKWRHVDDTFQIPPSSAAYLGTIGRHSCSPIRTSIGSCPLQHLQMPTPRVACSHTLNHSCMDIHRRLPTATVIVWFHCTCQLRSCCPAILFHPPCCAAGAVTISEVTLPFFAHGFVPYMELPGGSRN